MSKEIEIMSQSVEQWVRQRQTLDIKPETLKRIVKNERIELGKAVIEGNSKNIRLETGDVLFSKLAAKMDVENMFSFCEYMQFDIQKVFQETERKNKIHYPLIFFRETTPFIDPNDAFSCLRLFRKIHGDPEKLNKFWLKLDHFIYGEMAFSDSWFEAKQFRGFIKAQLKNISKRKDETIATEAKRLLREGEWSMVPFEI